MRELSIFCDESGDFGRLTAHSPRYLVGLVLHEQDKPIANEIAAFEGRLRNRNMDRFAPIHTAPLIRREGPYKDLDGGARKALWDALFTFFRRCDVAVRVLDVDKRWHGTGTDLEERIARELGTFLREDLAYFQSFDRVVIYYDHGQDELNRTLKIIFRSLLSNVEFRTVSPGDYLLFQVADLACTMALVEGSRQSGGMSKSESAFFGGAKKFKRTYLREFERKLI